MKLKKNHEKIRKKNESTRLTYHSWREIEIKKIDSQENDLSTNTEVKYKNIESENAS
jgi:hypothetical protein